MKTILSLFFILSITACSSGDYKEVVYLKNAASGEVVKCEETTLNSWINAIQICIQNKEEDGFRRIEVFQFNEYGYPIDYKFVQDPLWPDSY